LEDTHEERSKAAANNMPIAISECFSWAVDPYLKQFESLAPPLADISSPNLGHFFRSESYECELGAIDDNFVLGSIERSDTEFGSTPPPPGFEDDLESEHLATTFPSFTVDQVRVVCNDWNRDLLDINPTKVTVDDQVLFFKAVQPPGNIVGKHEVGKYEQMVRADLGPDVHVSRLYGVAVDEHQQLTGLLLHYIAIAGTFDDIITLGPETPQSSRERWAEQIQTSLRALHNGGIVWGDAKAANVAIDVYGDAWIIDFGGGYTRGWVDEENTETIEGDLQGLKEILSFISNGGIANTVLSSSTAMLRQALVSTSS